MLQQAEVQEKVPPYALQMQKAKAILAQLRKYVQLML